MLTCLEIRNIAVIEDATVDFCSGFTILTGETGAGKSILVDALGLVLGDRANTSLIREDSKQGSVSAIFNLMELSEVRHWLASRELLEDAELVLHRTISRDGRSKAYINGTPVPVAMLREISRYLVDIHGQHEHYSLLRGDNARRLLDGYANLNGAVKRLEEMASDHAKTAQTLKQINSQEAERANRADYLRFALREIEGSGITDGSESYDDLQEEYKRLAYRENLLENIGGALQLIHEDERSAQTLISDAIQALGQVKNFDNRLESPYLLLTEILTQLQDVAGVLQNSADQESDPNRLNWLNERLAQIQALARKHSIPPSELKSKADSIKQELDLLEDSTAQSTKLEGELANLASAYNRLEDELHVSRAHAAEELSNRITDAARQLGMPEAVFQVKLQRLESERFPPYGRDQVKFLVSTNSQQPPGPLAQVASGGELSRLSLAIQVLAKGTESTPIMVFDEVDTGIGGRVAELVGRRLKRLSSNGEQVLCVTHLPQVAALADWHFSVRKTNGRKSTRTEVVALNEIERIEEIASMLGGLKITASARDHARKLIEQARDSSQ